MGKIKRATASLPEDLLNDSTAVTGASSTETFIKGLRLIKRAAAKLFGPVNLIEKCLNARTTTLTLAPTSARTHFLVHILNCLAPFNPSQDSPKVNPLADTHDLSHLPSPLFC